MDPGQEKNQQGDQLEAHSVALPADGSPTLEKHLDDGKDLGKVWSHVFPETMSGNMVSGDHGEESRCSSPPLSVDCTTSSSSSSSQDDWATSFSGSCISSTSGSSTTIFSEDEVGSEWTSSYGSISTTSCSPTVDRPYAELEMAQTSLESTRGLDKREEPLLSSADYRLFGISQCHQVGLVGNVARVTSVTGVSRKRTKGSDSEEEPPAKKTRDTVAEEELSSKRTRKSDYAEEELPSKRTRKSDYAEEEPSAKSTRYNQTREELLSKRTRDSGAEEEIPAKRSRNSDDEEEPVLSPSTNTLSEDPLLSSPVISPSQGSVQEDSFQSSPVSSPLPMTFWVDPIFSPFSLSPQSACEDPILSSPVFSPSPRMPCEGPIVSVHSISPPISEDPILSSPVLSRPRRTACEDPIVSSPVVSSSPSPYCKIPSLSFPCICVWMKSQMDKEEEPIPSTSEIGSDRTGERVSSRQVWIRPHYDLSSDDSD